MNERTGDRIDAFMRALAGLPVPGDLPDTARVLLRRGQERRVAALRRRRQHHALLPAAVMEAIAIVATALATLAWYGDHLVGVHARSGRALGEFAAGVGVSTGTALSLALSLVALAILACSMTRAPR